MAMSMRFLSIRLVLRLTALCVGLVGFGLPLPGGASEVRIGVLAQRGPEKTLEMWAPTASYLPPGAALSGCAGR
jgi:hypothetical protein